MRATLGLSVLLFVGCSAIVGGPANEPDPLPCFQADGAPNPCPDGMLCIGEQCVPDTTCVPTCTLPQVCIGGMCRAPALEVCNGLDDDGDGIEDNGLRNDEDADGFFTCDEDTTRVDCVDRPGVGASIYPGAPELCDGFDNDCNPTTNDGSATAAMGGCDPVTEACAAPVGGGAPECLPRMSCRLTGCLMEERCDAVTDRCIPDVPPVDCTMPGMECRPGERCDTVSRLCEPIRDLPVGELCGSDAECASRICYPWDALDLPSTAGSMGRCGSPCCTSTNCNGLGTEVVCWAGGTGARTCMPRAITGDLGDAPYCTRRSDCGTDACRLATVSGDGGTVNGFACGPSPGTATGSCDRDTDCASGLCYSNVCTIPCGSQRDCSGFDRTCAFGECLQVGVCAYVSRGGDWVSACFVNSGLTTSPNGETCSGNGDCQEFFCHNEGSNSFCRGTCCSDADCGGLRCRPVDNFGWEMRCVPDDVVVE